MLPYLTLEKKWAFPFPKPMRLFEVLFKWFSCTRCQTLWQWGPEGKHTNKTLNLKVCELLMKWRVCFVVVCFCFSNPFEIQNCRYLASLVLYHTCIATHTHSSIYKFIDAYTLFLGHLPWEVLVRAKICQNSWSIICHITAIPREPL